MVRLSFFFSLVFLTNVSCGELQKNALDGGTADSTEATADAAAVGSTELKELYISVDGLAPEFSPSTTQYQLQVSLFVRRIVVRPVPLDPTATVTVNGQPYQEGGDVSIAVAGADTTITVTVANTAGDERDYQLKIDRSAEIFPKQIVYGKSEIIAQLERTGHSVSISGNTLAVGAPNQANGGVVHLYQRVGSEWNFVQDVVGANTEVGDLFGQTVVVTTGDKLAVGAPGEDGSGLGFDPLDDNGATDSGAVYIFERTGETWSQELYVKSFNSDAKDYFGSSIAVQGTTVAIGAPGEDSSATQTENGTVGEPSNNDSEDSGAVYLYRVIAQWKFDAYMKASNTGTGDRFGTAVALYGDRLVVGAPGEDSDTAISPPTDRAVNSGAVYEYRKIAGTWNWETFIKAPESEIVPNNQFGTSVALGETLLVVGQPMPTPSKGAGNVQTYRWANNGWIAIPAITPPAGKASDHFGQAVALVGDSLVIGSPQGDTANATDSGSVFTLQFVVDRWVPVFSFVGSSSKANSGFGSSVSISYDSVVVGAPEDSDKATGLNGTIEGISEKSGAFFIFQ